MRVLITGGTGLIGRALSRHLAAAGDEAILLSRSARSPEGLPAGVRVVKWDGRTADGWGHLVEGASAIVNLAGANLAGEGLFPSRWTSARKAIIRESRLAAGRAVTEAVFAAKDKPACVIQSSGAGIYGSRGDEKLCEETPAGTGFLPELAIQWEASTVEVENVGVRQAVIRTGVVLTLDGGSLPLMVLPFRFFVGGPLGNGRQWWHWIHIEDHVRAIIFLIRNHQAHGAFNLCSPNPLMSADFARIIGRVMGRPAFFPVPSLALQALMGETSSLLLESTRATPCRLHEAGFTFQYPELEEAFRHLLGKSP